VIALELPTMTSASRAVQHLLPLKPASYRILLALGDEVMHGYGIMQSLSDKTGGREKILPGTLYVSLARMVEEGLVEELEAPDGVRQTGGVVPPRAYKRIPLIRLRAKLVHPPGDHSRGVRRVEPPRIAYCSARCYGSC
jgi:hypothetical protein